MDGKPSTIYIIRPLTQAVKQNGIDQTDQKCKGSVRITHNKEKSGPFIPQHIQIQFVIHGNFPDFFNVKRSQSGSTGNKDRLRCFSGSELIFFILTQGKMIRVFLFQSVKEKVNGIFE